MKTDPETGEILATYAVGNGEIKMTWCNPVTKNATGRPTTVEDYVNNKPPKGFRFSQEKMAYVEGPTVNFEHVGWYDSPDALAPAHDPGRHSPCIVCAEKLFAPMVTISLAHEQPENRRYSFFFRAHKECWFGLSARDQFLIESAIIDSTK